MLSARRPVQLSLLTKGLERRHQMRDAVDHGDVDRLSPARLTRFHRSGEQTDHQIERAAAEIGDKIERRRRRPVGIAQAMQRARQGEIVDVVARLLRHRSLLPPARHPCVDQRRGLIAMADIRTEPEPFHHRSGETLSIRASAFATRSSTADDRLRLLEVERNRTLVTIVEVEARRLVRLDARLGDAVDPQHVGAEVAQQRSGERRGADPAHLDDAKAIQRSRHDQVPSLGNQCQRWNRTASSIAARPTRAALALTLWSS